MSKTIKELKEEIKAKGRTPADTSGLGPDDQHALLTEQLAEITGESGGEQATPELKGADQAAEMLRMMAQMRNDMAEMGRRHAEEIASLKAQAASPEKSTFQDPAFIKAMRAINERHVNDKGLVRMDYVNEEDRLETPIVFYTNKRNQKLFHVTIAGQHVADPLNMGCVRFRNLFWFRNPETGRIETRGELVVSSKALAEWIRKDGKYGVEIFESVDEVMKLSKNSEWADVRDRHLVAMRSKLDSDVDRLAHHYGIPVGRGADYAQVRKAVAEKLADEEIAQGSHMRSERDKEMQRSNAIIQQRLGNGIPILQP